MKWEKGWMEAFVGAKLRHAGNLPSTDWLHMCRLIYLECSLFNATTHQSGLLTCCHYCTDSGWGLRESNGWQQLLKMNGQWVRTGDRAGHHFLRLNGPWIVNRNVSLVTGTGQIVEFLLPALATWCWWCAWMWRLATLNWLMHQGLACSHWRRHIGWFTYMK